MNTKPLEHKHDWKKIDEIKRDNVQIKISECSCGSIKIDTTQLVDRTALATLGIRDTKLIPLGDYENDRLVLMAFESHYKNAERIITASLAHLTKTFKELVQQAERRLPKDTSAMQIVADRMEKLGFGYTDPAFFDVPYRVEIEPVDDGESIALFLRSLALIPARSRVRELLCQFGIKSLLLHRLNNEYDAKGRNIELLSNALNKIIRSEIKESTKEFFSIDIIMTKIETQLGIPPKESESLILNNDNVIVGEKNMLTTIDAKRVLADEVDLEGKEDPWKRPIKLKHEN